jgi:magnesium-transporting ATPase (P-type)
MVGDGVNDVPALKAARLAIAQGSGAQMARSVADVVLVRGTFAAVPPMVGEGRRVFRNLQRVAKLFVTKSVFAIVLILSIGLTPIAYPLLPRHLTIAAAITIGIPAFFLALAPSGGGFQTHGFLRDVARFSVPAGTAAGLGVLASYLFALNVANMSLTSSQTVATTVLVLVGLYLILALEASGLRRGAAVSVMVAALAALYFFVLAFPPTRHFFALSAPGFGVIVLSVIGAALAIVFLVLTDDRFIPPLAFMAEDSGGKNVGVSKACVTAVTCIDTCATIEPAGFAVAKAGIEISVLPISGCLTPSSRYCGYPRWYVAVMSRTRGSATAVSRARPRRPLIRPSTRRKAIRHGNAVSSSASTTP